MAALDVSSKGRCFECNLQHSDKVRPSVCSACHICGKLMCMNHMRKHHERRGVDLKSTCQKYHKNACNPGLHAIQVKGSPRSIMNTSALCAYASVLQCLASCFPSSVLKECTDCIGNGDTNEKSDSDHHKRTSYGATIHTQMISLLQCLHLLQNADKMPLEIPAVLMLRILPKKYGVQEETFKCFDGEPEMGIVTYSDHQMRDAASVFCDFAFLHHSARTDAISEDVASAIKLYQSVFQGQIRQNQFNILSFPASLWLRHQKDIKQHQRGPATPTDRSKRLSNLINGLFSSMPSDSHTLSLCNEMQSLNLSPINDEWPKILVLQFDRTSVVQTGQRAVRKKISSRFDLPFHYQHTGCAMQGRLNGDPSPSYSLQALIVHEGADAQSGHFTTFIQRRGKWYYCSDTSYCVCSEDAVDNAEVYIAFYCLV